MTRVEKFNKYVFILVTLMSYYFIDLAKDIVLVDYWVFRIINVVISFLLTYAMFDVLFPVIYSIKFFKKMLLGKQYIEGVWIIFGKGTLNGLEITEYEIAEFKQIIESDSIEGVVYAISNKNQFSEYHCVSNIAKLLGDKLSYYSCYDYMKDHKMHAGMAKGHFIISPGAKYPDTYRGLAIGLDDGFIEQEYSWKVKDIDLKKKKKLGKEEWRKYLLEEAKKSIQGNRDFIEQLHDIKPD